MDNIWVRRANNSKLSLTTSNSGPISNTSSPAAFPKRFSTSDGLGSAKASPFGTSTAGIVTSPTSTAPTNFGLGSGVFASFGGGGAKSKPVSNPFESAMGSVGKPNDQSKAKDTAGGAAAKRGIASESSRVTVAPNSEPPAHLLKNKWVFWFRPPTAKNQGFVEYEKTIHSMAHCSSIEEFFTVYSHLKRVSTLPQVSEYHFFKWGIRPVWEDEINKKGGKWVVRLKKGVADRYWEDLLFALIGDQFGDAGEEVCGAVVSVRTGEDIISIWTRTDGGRVLKIRETMKHILNFPANTRVEFKSHDSSIQQRTILDEQRREKQNQHHHNNGNNGGSHGHKSHSGVTGAIGSGRLHHGDQQKS